MIQSCLSFTRKFLANVKLGYVPEGAFHLSQLTGQTIQVIIRISLLIITTSSQISQVLNSMQEENGVSTKTLGKKAFFIVKMTGWANMVWPASSGPGYRVVQSRVKITRG